MNVPAIVQALIASLTYLPLAFVLAACWVELVSFIKKSPRHQPGVTALLAGAVASAIACIAIGNLLPTPVGSPGWSGFTGIVSLVVVAATYGFRFYLKRNEPILNTKKLRDLQLAHTFALATSALTLIAGALTATGAGALGQLLGFLPLALLTTVILLEALSISRSHEAYQPSILAVLFATLASAATSIGAAAAGLPATGITPAWLSPWGAGAAVFIAFAYLSKVSTRKTIIRGRDPQIIALQTPAQRLKALSARPSPAAYTLALIVSLPLIGLTHLRFSPTREAALATISETAGSVKKITGGVAPSRPAVDQYATTDSSTGAVTATTPLPDTQSTAENPFGNDDDGGMTAVAPPVVARPPKQDEPPSPVGAVPGEAAGDDIPEVLMTGLTTSEDPPKTALNISAIKAYDDGAYFVSKVQPILKSHCYECHSTKKKKGGLQLHSAVSIREGADSGSILIAGNPDRSPIYTTTTLGEDDPDVMPGKGDLLSQKQQATLKKWILDGAHMDDGEISSALATPGNAGTFRIDKQAQRIRPPNASVIQALAQSGVQFRALSSNGALIKVDFSHTDRSRPILADLEAIAGNIYHLDLSRTEITDEDLAVIATYPVLHKLELSHTAIGDEGIRHLAALKYLDTLNLYNTSVGPGGLEALYGLKTLEKIYAFGSDISESAAKSAQEKIKGLTVVID